MAARLVKLSKPCLIKTSVKTTFQAIAGQTVQVEATVQVRSSAGQKLSSNSAGQKLIKSSSLIKQFSSSRAKQFSSSRAKQFSSLAAQEQLTNSPTQQL